VPGYDEMSRENPRKEKARSDNEALLSPVPNFVGYIFVDRSGQKRETDRRNIRKITQNYPGERRRENLELACIAEPISSHKAYPRGSWLREVSCRK
jgi:hypothetical protein